MKINVKKSCCIRIGQRYDIKCANITDSHGFSLPWVKEIRYLATYIISARQFRCSLTQAKRSFYRSFNAVFGKIGRLASEEVILKLVGSKRLPVLLYVLECYPLTKSDLSTLDFVITRILMKLFKSAHFRLINDSRLFFRFLLPSEICLLYTSPSPRD